MLKKPPCPMLWLALVAGAIAQGPSFAGDPVVQTGPETVDYSILITGSELLSGVYADGHTHFITRTLKPLGLNCVGSMSVDDKRLEIKEALKFARRRSRLVIVTGGLGPTDNDITRETLSEFTGVKLKEHPDVLAATSGRQRVAADELRANLRRQTAVPEGGGYLKNSTGTAVGLVFEFDEAVIVKILGDQHVDRAERKGTVRPRAHGDPWRAGGPGRLAAPVIDHDRTRAALLGLLDPS